MQCPHVSRIGGLMSVVCCLRMGHAKIEWYLLGPMSISIGSSSLAFQTPATCLCCMTCLMLSKAGKAELPALMMTDNGDSIDKPIRAHASLTNRSEISCQRASSKRWAYGDSSSFGPANISAPMRAWISRSCPLTNCKISTQRQGENSRKKCWLTFGKFSRAYCTASILLLFRSKSINLSLCSFISKDDF